MGSADDRRPGSGRPGPGPDASGADAPGGSPRSLHALDAPHFCMADVQTGVGPYLAIFLKSTRGFDAAQVGIAVAAGLTALGAVALVLFRPLWTTVVAQALIGGSGAVFPPAVAALSLGIVGRAVLPKRQSRNEAFNHGGNLVAAVLFGAVGFYVAQAGIFWCVVALGAAAAVAVLSIREGDIDHERARGGDGGRADAKDGATTEGGKGEASVGALLRDRRVLTFVGAVVLFHAANAAIGIGAAASNAGAGFLAKHAGYPVTFFALAGVGALGFLLYWWGMPETAPDAGDVRRPAAAPRAPAAAPAA